MKHGFVRMKARYPSRCSCGNRIRVGRQIFWHPESKQVRCGACGPKRTSGKARRPRRLRPRTKLPFLATIITPRGSYVVEVGADRRVRKVA
jgi:hypothetical protein